MIAPAEIQRWRSLGRVIAPEPQDGWWVSHASYPTALSMPDGSTRVFFSVRGAANRSSLAAVDLAIEGETWKVLGPVQGPLFGPGPRGAFDADGVTVTCVLRQGDRLLAYYLGWTVGGAVPFTNFIGLAVADGPEAPFERFSPAPILGRSRENPLSLGYPWVLRQAAGYRMWFGTHLAWGAAGLDMIHVIKEARSNDGLSWSPEERIAVPLSGAGDPAEFAVSRPVVVAEADGTLSMWYARRGPRYTLGFARSIDGVNWHRRDEAVTVPGAPRSWEQEERTYPCVFDHGQRRYMLYNGTGYGRTGFGLAILER